MENMRDIMRKFTMALNNIDEVYCSDRPQTGVKGSELWLLYALDDGELHSQKQICEEWGIPRTTLNSTIKRMEAEGYLTLMPIPGKRREMYICLTENGKVYAQQILKSIYEAEDQAMAATVKRYSMDFIDALDYFSVCLKSVFEKNEKRTEEHIEK